MSRGKVCQYCRLGNLHWQQTPYGFRLYTAAGTMHKCPERAQFVTEDRDPNRVAKFAPFAKKSGFVADRDLPPKPKPQQESINRPGLPVHNDVTFYAYPMPCNGPEFQFETLQ